MLWRTQVYVLWSSGATGRCAREANAFTYTPHKRSDRFNCLLISVLGRGSVYLAITAKRLDRESCLPARMFHRLSDVSVRFFYLSF